MPGQLPPGVVLDGKYLVLSALGSGRFGTVYRAVHVALQKPVAVKVLRVDDTLSARDFEQFRVEAEALGRLGHPHIVGVSDFGVDPRGDGTPYLVMDIMEGVTLDELARREGPQPLARVARWIDQVARALEHAHALGVAHGDLSARNVIVVGDGPDAVATVIDFGLARLLTRVDAGPEANAPAPSFSIGHRCAVTPEYAAPERLRGGPPSPAADVYALAVLAYLLLTGRHPFEGDARAVLRAQLTNVAPVPSTIGRALPSFVDAAIMAALAKSSAERPAGPAAFASRLTEGAREVARADWRRREGPRRLALAAVLAVAAATVVPLVAPQPLVERLEGATLDARFALTRPLRPDGRLLLVAIDDAALAADDRALSDQGNDVARVLARAFDRGVAAVAVDLLLPEAWAAADAFGDLVLRRADRLVLGMTTNGSTVVGPEALDPLVAAALGPDVSSRLFGLVAHERAPDGVVRRAQAAVLDQSGQRRPTLAGRLTEIAEPGARRLDRPVLVDYVADAAELDRMAWRQFADAVASGASFPGRLVIVGAEFTGSGDSHRVPGPGRLPVETSGLALQGLVASTLLGGPRLTEAPAIASWLATVMVAFAAALGLLWMRRLLVAAVTATTVAVCGVAAAVVAFRAGHVLPVAMPVLVCGVVAIAALLYRHHMPGRPE